MIVVIEFLTSVAIPDVAPAFGLYGMIVLDSPKET
jgi:hypothetical protein